MTAPFPAFSGFVPMEFMPRSSWNLGSRGGDWGRNGSVEVADVGFAYFLIVLCCC